MRQIELLIGQDGNSKIEIRDPGVLISEGYRASLPRNKQPFTDMVAKGLDMRRLSRSASGHVEPYINTNGYRDYRGVTVFGAGFWDHHLGIGLTTEIDKSEVFTGYYSFRNSLLTISGLSLLLAVIATMLTVTLCERGMKTVGRARDELEDRVEERTAALVGAEKRSRMLLESAPDAIVIIDSEATIQIANGQAERLFGYSRDEMVGNPIEMLVPESIREEHVGFRDGFIRTPGSLGMGTGREFCTQTKDGIMVPIEVSLNPLEAEEGTLIVAAIRDITDRKKAEEALAEAKNEAEAANRAKSDFLANMSHEIRTPMNAIIGMSHLALKTDLDNRQRNYVDKVHRSAESLLGIINDILDFSKIEAGKMDMETIPFHLDDVFDNLANLLGFKTEEKGIELLFDIPPDVPRELLGDPLRLGQILINLGNNAAKFTDEGEVVVRVRAKEVTDNETLLHFLVQDSGIGMTPEQQGRLFQAFSQADSTTSRKYGGTGLGLTISKRLSEMMGGEIWVESEYGKGSTFQFTARFGREESKTEKVTDVAPLSEVLRILIVDDSAVAREVMSEMLKGLGIEYDAVESGQAALDACSENVYDLVLMDWRMPGMDGIETTRLIQERESKTPRVILVSAFSREEAKEKSQGVSLSEILTKPVSPSTLLDAILWSLGKACPLRMRVTHREEDAQAAQAKLRGARVLLVEDNEINQELARELLANGCIITDVANNGREALELLDINCYDGVLMDCQMPVMDGFEATREIRKQDRFKDLPVLAMTANVMSGDREKVLDAGMNDHIGKPINVNDMFSTMAKWITPSEPLVESQTAAPAPVAEPVQEDIPPLVGIDTDIGLSITQGNRKLYLKLLRKFRDSQRDFIEQFEESRKSADPDAATRCAHTLKGVAGNIGAKGIQVAAEALEKACKDGGEADEIGRLLDEVRVELITVVESLETMDRSVASDTAGDGELDVKAMGPLLGKLRELLEDDDAEASGVVDELLKQPGLNPYEAVVKRITKLVSEYDFEEALEELATLENTLITE